MLTNIISDATQGTTRSNAAGADVFSKDEHVVIRRNDRAKQAVFSADMYERARNIYYRSRVNTAVRPTGIF